MSAVKDPSARHAPSFSLANRMLRVVWMITWTCLCRFTPPPLWAWRRLVLRLFGARIGDDAKIYGSARIWLPGNLDLGRGAMLGRGVNCYNQGRIAIGAGSVVSWNATLCSSSHDFDDPGFPLVLRPIRIGTEVWIAAEAFVGPGVSVEDGAVLGACSVAMRDLEGWALYSGNPAQKIRDRPKVQSE